jgi:hypothetical protein
MELHPNNMHRGWPMFNRSMKSLIHSFRQCRCPSFPYISNMMPHPSRTERNQLNNCDSLKTSFLPSLPSFEPTDCTFHNFPDIFDKNINKYNITNNIRRQNTYYVLITPHEGAGWGTRLLTTTDRQRAEQCELGPIFGTFLSYVL